MDTPNISFNEMLTGNGNHDGYEIVVNGRYFGNAVLCDDQCGGVSYDVMSGVGTFEADDTDEILAILLERLVYVSDTLELS